MFTCRRYFGSVVPENGIQEYKETFQLYDEDKDGIVTREQIAIIMRSLGISISDGELDSMIKTHCKETTRVDFPEFLAMMSKCLAEAPSKSEEERSLVDAFKVFDRQDNGRITSRELRTIVMTLGESMDTKLVDDMIKDADMEGDGLIDYKQFVSKLLKEESPDRPDR
ncbi:hypothetical protein LSH36_45g12019 [Paralvinella palmiformis]|uniref:EF-hand domain-containing protein n=1 Tax=Paralvinella palmiformis TaxID=53620 RepID=A0AAD9NDB8_9ANNE|nr:hypothetical protein LSH36_45g12019 [Paralvinella palmiformis]